MSSFSFAFNSSSLFSGFSLSSSGFSFSSDSSSSFSTFFSSTSGFPSTDWRSLTTGWSDSWSSCRPSVTTLNRSPTRTRLISESFRRLVMVAIVRRNPSKMPMMKWARRGPLCFLRTRGSTMVIAAWRDANHPPQMTTGGGVSYKDVLVRRNGLESELYFSWKCYWRYSVQ